MNDSLANRAPSTAIKIPEERVIAMIAACAAQIKQVHTIADAKEASNVAEAIAAVTRKVDVAREVKHSAVRMLIEAEAKLGEITAMIPRAPGRNAKSPQRGKMTKKEILAEHGVSKSRANYAERLSRVPAAEVERVVASGANTMHAIGAKLGLYTHAYELREKRNANLAFLCEEAVSLLARCVKQNKVPHAGTVAEMIQRYANITEHGNKKA